MRLSLLVVLLLAGCGGSEIDIREIPGSPPVERLTIIRSRQGYAELAIDLSEAADWKTLVSLDVFKGFWPRMTAEEARARWGPPDEVKDKEYCYDRPAGRVSVKLVVDRSEGLEFRQWQLSAKPEEAAIAEVFRPELLNQIRGHLEPRVEIVITHPKRNGPVVGAEIHSGRVESVTWYQQ